MNKRTLFLLLLLIFIISKGASACWGNGGLEKGCLYEDETPIEGAQVCITELQICDYTGGDGWVSFQDIPPGTYHLWIDIDGDGVPETDGEEVTITSGETTSLTNWYPLPKQQVL